MACINLNDTVSPMEVDDAITGAIESPMEVDDDENSATLSPMEVDDEDITDVKVNGVRVETEIKVVISVCHPTTGATGFESNVRCETSFSANINQHSIPSGATPASS